MALLNTILRAELTVSTKDENKNIKASIEGTDARLTPSSTPPASESFDDDRQLSGGTDTIDLGSLPDSAVAAVKERFRGLKLRAVKVLAADANTADIVVKPGATDPHDLFGASGLNTIPAGGFLLFYAKAGSGVIATGVANIVVTSADSDAKYSIHLVAGT